MRPPTVRPGDHDSIARANRIGVLSMIGAMACFIVNDGLVKYVSQTLPAAQLIFVRGAMASMLMLAVVQAMGAMEQIREIARGWVATRSVVDAIAAFLLNAPVVSPSKTFVPMPKPESISSRSAPSLNRPKP